ncbi:MAG: beta-N-acetylglucosaminidase domain-containing protein [Polyangiaceae bacterium]|nr:beta-N-acetylglucosaminidase domain-containing protein [Polyangiaceae bacterium]MBK8940713.1 beta-N-acetylglucosaminidase domain-containing protein [Polyangiaceae bacterium]
MNRLGHGVVEGFYGRPWSLEARLRMVRTIGELGLDTYAYAPKGDPLHRQRWWEPLPVEELRAFGQLGDVAAAYGARLVYGVAPQRLFGGKQNLRARGDLAGDERFDALVGRCASLLARGVRAFMLLFDDTWTTVLPFLASFDAGQAHARVAALALERLREHDPGVSLAVVPAIYSGRAAELSRGALAYLRGLASLTPIPIAWTGPKIFSSYVSGADLEAFREHVGVTPWIWNNAIANDWLPVATGEPLGRATRQRLCFGPATNISPEVHARAAGVLLNGAREPRVTEAALAAMAEEIRAPTSYEPAAALERGLARAYGAGAGAVARLASVVGGHPLAAPRPGVPSSLEEALRAARSGAHGARAVLEAALAPLARIDEDLAHDLGESAGLAELAPTARKVSLGARALLAAVRSEERASALAREAMTVGWSTGLDEHLADVARGRFLARRA